MVHGAYYDGTTSAQQRASIRLNSDATLQVVTPEGQLICVSELEQLVISPRIGNTPRYLDFADGGRFETTDNEAIDQWLTLFGRDKRHRLLNFLESHTQFVLLSVLVVVLFCWWMVNYGIPAAAKVVAYQLPASVLDHSSVATMELLDRSFLAESQLPAERQHALQTLFASYFPDSQTFRFRVLLRDGGELGANAFALPDGTLVFTDQLIELIGNDEELLAVLGHEIGHVLERHSLRQTLQGSTVAVIAVLVAGDVSVFGDLFAALPTLIVNSAYSRDFERDADSYAFGFLRDHGLSPKLFANVMRKLLAQHQHERLARQSDQASDEADASPASEDLQVLPPQDPSERNWLDYLSSHPATLERIERAERAE